MTAAIMAGLKPHIDAAVKEQLAAMLAGMLAKVAPELLAKSVPVVPETTSSDGQKAIEEGTAAWVKANAKLGNGTGSGTKKHPVNGTSGTE
jgi:hypothetical protein